MHAEYYMLFCRSVCNIYLHGQGEDKLNISFISSLIHVAYSIML